MSYHCNRYNYHRPGVCEGNFQELAKQITQMIRDNKLDCAIFQISQCIREREGDRQDRINRGDPTDEAHDHVIRLLYAFLESIQLLNQNLINGSIPPEVIPQLYIYYCSAGGFVFHFRGITDTCDKIIQRIRDYINNQYITTTCAKRVNIETQICPAFKRDIEEGEVSKEEEQGVMGEGERRSRDTSSR